MNVTPPTNRIVTLAVATLAYMILGYGIDNALAAPGPSTGSLGLADINNEQLAAQEPVLLVGPVKGLTTAWHAVPERIAVPMGSDIEFRVETSGKVRIKWTGASEVARDSSGSTASCSMKGPGMVVVNVRVTGPGMDWSRTVLIDAIDIAPERILTNVSASVDAVDLDEDSSNAEAMAYLLGESIAELQPVYEGRPGLDGHLEPSYYATSVDRTIHLTAEVDPPQFASMLEWALDGQILALGDSVYRSLDETGEWIFEVGPVGNPGRIEIQTYSVSITSISTREPSLDEQFILPEGQSVTFEAATDPPGFEGFITWLAATQFGSSSQLLGTGPVFAVQFDDTFGQDPNQGSFQWLGVKADNAAFEQQQTD